MVLRFGQAWLFLLLPVLAACDDLSLRRPADPAAADTAAESEAAATRAPRSTGSKQPTSPAIEEAGFSEIRRSLRRLVVAEETFFAENGTYSDDLSLIGFRPDNNTNIRFLWLSRDGWAASGTHSGIEGKDCVVFVGAASAPPTTLRYVRSGPEGVVVCDDRSRSARTAPARPAPATPPPPASRAPEAAANPLDLLDPQVAMKVDLRNLAHSQETYFAMQGFYARRTSALALQYLWHRDVRIEILAADAQSWAARATHARFPGRSCVIWFGAVSQRPRTEAQRRVEDRAGIPVCDER